MHFVLTRFDLCIFSYEFLKCLMELEPSPKNLYYVFNTLLFTLLVFHIYWWKLICAMIMRQMGNRGKVGEDIRSGERLKFMHTWHCIIFLCTFFLLVSLKLGWKILMASLSHAKWPLLAHIALDHLVGSSPLMQRHWRVCCLLPEKWHLAWARSVVAFPPFLDDSILWFDFGNFPPKISPEFAHNLDPMV